MKKIIFLFIILSLLINSCTKTVNSPEFIEQVTGRYLYNADEIVEVYFQESDLYIKWRGANDIKPLKLNDHTFFVKEMNEKVQFLTNPANQILYFSLVPKQSSQPVTYNFKKLEDHEMIPREHLKNNHFDKALEGYLEIQKKDSLDHSIVEADFNKKGYQLLRKNKFDEAIQIFKINAALYPESANVYDSLAEAFMKSGDTMQAMVNYKRSLALDSGNLNAKKQLERLKKKK